MSEAQATEVARRRLEQAEASGTGRSRSSPRTRTGRPSLFQDVVDDYPEYEKAAEAQFRAGRAWYRAAEYDDAAEALEKYMRIAPVNPHLAEVEETLYQSGTRYIRQPHGFLGLFGTDEAGLEALQFVAENFRAGRYADDALLALGDYYREDAEFDTAALRYKELLIRYPGSDLALATRLRLGDTYSSRDQGDPYLAGFVDIGPPGADVRGGGEADRPGPERAGAGAGAVRGGDRLDRGRPRAPRGPRRGGGLRPTQARRVPGAPGRPRTCTGATGTPDGGTARARSGSGRPRRSGREPGRGSWPPSAWPRPRRPG